MNKTELVEKIAEQMNVAKKDIDAVVKAFTETVTEELAKGGSVQLIGFGTFELGSREERQGRNPQTGEAMTIPARNVPRFKPSKALKDAVN